MKPDSTPRRSLITRSLRLLALCAVVFSTLLARADWTVDGSTVYFSDHVGYSADGTEYSGTVSLRMDPVVVSGQGKIVTTILAITPAPGFSYTLRKAGGVNGTVEIEFTSDTCQSKFSFLYKPGLTRIDYGVMRCK